MQYYGFADTAKLGKNLQLNVQFKSRMSSFGWTPVIKDELTQIMNTRGLDCPAILASCTLDAHFTQWKIPEYGEVEWLENSACDSCLC